MCSLCVVLALGRVFSPQRENSGGVLFMACTGGKGRKKEECQKWKTANHYQEKKKSCADFCRIWKWWKVILKLLNSLIYMFLNYLSWTRNVQLKKHFCMETLKTARQNSNINNK